MIEINNLRLPCSVIRSDMQRIVDRLDRSDFFAQIRHYCFIEFFDKLKRAEENNDQGIVFTDLAVIRDSFTERSRFWWSGPVEWLV